MIELRLVSGEVVQTARHDVIDGFVDMCRDRQNTINPTALLIARSVEQPNEEPLIKLMRNALHKWGVDCIGK